MAELGSKKRPAIIRVHTRDDAEQLLAIAQKNGITLIAGVEPDRPVDVSDLRKALSRRGQSLVVEELESRKMMRMTPLASMFPDVAAKETRVLRVAAKHPVLPAGDYAFVEAYCGTPRCSCGTVGLRVMAETGARFVASIVYRLGPLDDDDERCYLDLDSGRDKVAEVLLALFETVLLRDPVFVERIERHHAMVRAVLDAPERGTIAHRPAVAARQLRAATGPRVFLFDGSLNLIGHADVRSWEHAIRAAGGVVALAAERCGIAGVTGTTRAFTGRSLGEARAAAGRASTSTKKR